MTLKYKTKYFRLDRLQIRNIHPIGVKKVRKKYVQFFGMYKI